jgi:hypothetical protein
MSPVRPVLIFAMPTGSAALPASAFGTPLFANTCRGCAVLAHTRFSPDDPLPQHNLDNLEIVSRCLNAVP